MTWVQGEPPERLQKNVQAWRDLNPDYEVNIWNEDRFFRELRDDIENGTGLELPKELIDYYYDTKIFAMKAEVIKMYFMRKYGGVYADMDMHAVKGITEVFGEVDHPLLCGIMVKPLVLRWMSTTLPDGFFIMSPKDTDLWDGLVKRAIQNIKNGSYAPVCHATNSIYDIIKLHNTAKLCKYGTVVLNKKDIVDHTIAIHECDGSWSSESFIANASIAIRDSEYVFDIIILIVLIIVVTVISLIISKSVRNKSGSNMTESNDYSKANTYNMGSRQTA